jgi:hypothetical protein
VLFLYELCITSINSPKSTAPTIKTLFTSPSIENDNFIGRNDKPGVSDDLMKSVRMKERE